jgi:hypothetical protein
LKSQHKLALSAGLLAMVAPVFAGADIIVASHDLVIRRGPTKESSTSGANLHAKASTNNSTDRVVLLRFDSANFGANTSAATFLLNANPDTVTQFQGTFNYRVWGVNDGDPQDEVFTEAGYNPGDANTVYDGSANLIDTTQLTNLGDVNSISAGDNFNFSSAALTSFIQADTNGTVALLVERLSLGGNSTFYSRENQTAPPRLDITVVPEPTSLALLGLGSLLVARRRRH